MRVFIPAVLLLVATLVAEEPKRQRVQAIVCVQEGCAPCRKMERECEGLKASGWLVQYQLGKPNQPVDPEAHIVFVDNSVDAFPREWQVKATPTIIIYRDGKPVWYKAQRISAKDLANKIAELARK